MSRHPIIGVKPPPVAQRPTCPQCGKVWRLRWNTNRQTYIGEDGREVIKFEGSTREWTGYDTYGPFCRLRCAADYGVAAQQRGE